VDEPEYQSLPDSPSFQDSTIPWFQSCGTRAKQSQSGPTPSPDRVQRRQTNPIRAWGAPAGGTKCAKQTQFAPVEEDRWGKPGPQTRRNAFGSPIHPTCGRKCAKQTQFCPTSQQAGYVGQTSVRNKPNSARPTGRPRPSEGESCETNPIWRGPTLQPGRNGTKQSQFEPGGQLPAPRSVRNKANSALGGCRARASPEPAEGTPNPPRADCAKQSQTEVGWGIWGMSERHTVRNKANSSIADCGFRPALRWDTPCGPPGQGPVVQTNPIDRSQSCKTNPILQEPSAVYNTPAFLDQ